MDDLYRWSEEKNSLLVERYGFGFERIVEAIDRKAVIVDRDHPNVTNYGHQRVLIVEIDNYAWVAPYISNPDHLFFKTMFPDRRMTKRYLRILQ